MLTGSTEFQELFMRKELNMTDKRFDPLIKKFQFRQILNSDIINNSDNINNSISYEINESENIVIDIYEESTNKYFIICFNENIHIINQSNQAYINKFLTDDCRDKLFILNKAKNDFIKITKIQDDKLKNNQKIDKLEEEIYNFMQNFNLCRIYKTIIIKIWKIIQRCVSGYLIRKAYSKSLRNEDESFIPDIERPLYNNKVFKEDEFVILSTIGLSNTCAIRLAYYIGNERLYCIKSANSEEEQKLLDREITNYQKLYNPLICYFYGTISNNRKSLVIEFIDGKSLDLYVKDANIAEKYQLIYQIMLVIKYLHSMHFIYRDLKPNNVIFNGSHAVLIDFDQMIESDRKDVTSTCEFTRNFGTIFSAPEICEGNCRPSDKTDVYSIGMMIYYILMETNEIDQINLDTFKEKYPIHYNMFLRCTEKDQEKRPSVNQLLAEFGNFIYSSPKELISQDFTNESYYQFKIINFHFLTVNNTFIFNALAHYYNDIFSQNELAKKFLKGDYFEKDINRGMYYLSLAANQNHPAALYNLGIAYIDYNINKALHYLSLSANLQYAEALFKIGFIYFLGIHVPINIEKAIYYFELAAKQNHSGALNNLGLIYQEKKDIEKAVHYYTLAANLKDPNAYHNLGTIYSDENYEGFDINKAISCYQFAADNDITASMYKLGMIYSDGKYVQINAEKAIYYLTKGADKNDILCLLNLGSIYFQGEIIPVDIDKAIKYFKLAADQNNPDAQYNLAFIYSTDRYIYHDSEKAIKYYMLAASQNHVNAQFNLGLIYYKGIIVPKNIEKSLKYMKLAADQNNNPNAQYFLCRYYSSGVDIIPNYKIAIHYLTLASNQGFTEAQYDLGFLYYEAKHVSRDMKKAIDLMTQAANKNYVRAQYDLGNIYFEGKYVKRDVNKAINYFKLASKQNHIKALIYLGVIYSNGFDIPIDAYKAIYYLLKAADQHNSEAQFYLGKIYFTPECKVFDIKKAIYYMELAAEQNHTDAQNFLGALYMDDKFVQRDIKKAISYLTISADKNCAIAQKNLGFIYLNKKYEDYDIQKAVHYLLLAAKNGIPDAQGALGVIYLQGLDVPQDIHKALEYLHLSAENRYHLSQQILGDLYFEGRVVGRNVSKSIYYYKEALITNNERIKNNLAVIYKNGFGGIKKNVELAKMYLEEAIQQKKCAVSMFNLAKIYYFEEEEKGIKMHNKSIQLLIMSANSKLDLSITFLFMILLKRFKVINSIIIEKELKKANIESQQLADSLYEKYLFLSPLLHNEDTFENAYDFMKTYDLIFINEKVCFSNQFIMDKKKEPTEQVKQLIKINDGFYEGFGNDLCP
ncbi:hypothetical protein M9Y10_024662 [Tritrichomonas musculus]|uniref:Protein kinase domain-containing protein n=1 Tax=Tritrichomonas musculus TaxID=1915356 RepID=A0ABR2HD89_9EUKA